MAVAEIFISAFITVLFEKLASADLIRLARSEGIYSQLKKCNDILSQINAVLTDAGQKHLRERAVELWLNKLQHLAYDIDDVLDDLATEAMRRQLKEESHASTSSSKVLKIFPTCCTNITPHTIKYGRKMDSKLDEITAELQHLVEQKNMLGLNSNVERSHKASRRLDETSLVDVSGVVGREGDKEALLSKLLGDESCSENVNIVSIVGLGGIGKTTLAQVLYNEKKVKEYFELKSWVCVSDDFNVFNISKIIYKDVCGEEKKFENLNQLQVALTEKLSKKRFLLVLDDVWNENYKDWELLQRPFVVGAPGSKVVVTTRSTKVALVMDSIQAYPLELLSNEEALSLFAQHALGKPNFGSHPTFRMHGEGIVKKCGRLPLALITLGRVLRTKTNDEEWEEVLNSEIWNLENEGEILPALRLSYYDLPPHLKQMFAYCSLFPKGYVFDKDELVLLWMAEGFLCESYDSKSMESLGLEWFEELNSRSFFQHSTNDKLRYTMHDLINDLATRIAGEFFLTLDEKMDADDRSDALEKFHHLSFIRKKYSVYKKFKALYRARRLRTFLAMSVTITTWQSFHLSNKVLVDLLPQLQLLRVLSLAYYWIDEVPQSIGSLKHLRYLNFSHTCISCLPEQVGDLHNLQSLLLSSCGYLSSLPDSCVKLINMRHLDIRNTPKLDKIPLGIAGFTSLRTLSKVIIGGSNGFKISDLKGLVHLEGELSIQGLHTVMNAMHAKEANLKQKKGLCDLEMEWNNVFDDSRDETIEYQVLEALRPYEKLRSLKILYFGGLNFPSWVGDPSFVCLTKVTLSGCRRCTCLPTLGHLRSLQELYLESMSGLNRLGSELLGSADSCHGNAFPLLEVLEFKDMQAWEIWLTNSGDKERTVGSFPCLRKISIKNCPRLAEVAIEAIPSLQDLYIKGCSIVVLKRMVGLSSSIVRLRMRNISGLAQLHGEVLEHLGAMEDLYIEDCDELRYLWESKLEACEKLLSLCNLEIRSCQRLISLEEKNVDLGISLKSVNVSVYNCPMLTTYECPYGVEKLEIDDCHSLTSLIFPTAHDTPSIMKALHIRPCHNWEGSWLPNNFLSSLLSIHIGEVPNLRSFPEGYLVHLTSLRIYDCDELESIPEKGYGFYPHFCLGHLHINSCKNLKSIPMEHLQSLTSLERLWIVGCPSMTYSFPCGLWPPNLSILTIGSLKKPISMWGLQNFPTSLVELKLYGNDSGVVLFAKTEDVKNSHNNDSSSFLLPPSLTSLCIEDFMDLKSLSKGLQHLICLETLEIQHCPKLKDLPETLLPSLSSLWVTFCPVLGRRCRYKKGDYWPIISQIPWYYLVSAERQKETFDQITIND